MRGGAVDFQPSIERGDAVGKAAKPRAASRVRAADAVVGDLDRDRTVVPVHAYVRALACAYLVVLVSDSAIT